MKSSHVDSPIINTIDVCAGLAGLVEGVKRAFARVGFRLRTVAYSEIEAWACANLVAKMEAGVLDSAPIWTDLRTFPGAAFRGRVGAVIGGIPCQGFSSAGIGLADLDPRHLFPAYAALLCDSGADIGILENVNGLISARLRGDHWADPAGTPVLLHILRELERRGFRAAWIPCSAAEVGAPHQRIRVFVMAYRDRRREQQPAGCAGEGGDRTGDRCQDLANRLVARLQEWARNGRVFPDERPAAKRGSSFWPAGPGSGQFIWEAPRVMPRLMGHAGSLSGERGGGSRVVREQALAQPAEGLQRERPGDAAGCSGQEIPDACSRGQQAGGQLRPGQPDAGGQCQAGLADADSSRRASGGDDRGMGRVEESAAPGIVVDPAIGVSDGRGDRTGRRLEQPEGGAPGPAGASPWIPAIESAVGRNADGLLDWARLSELSGLSAAELEEIRDWMCRTDDRIDELRAYGNAVVPETVERAILLLMSDLIGIDHL
jgi:site-specific DNA-cytosine methylase